MKKTSKMYKSMSFLNFEFVNSSRLLRTFNSLEKLSNATTMRNSVGHVVGNWKVTPRGRAGELEEAEAEEGNDGGSGGGTNETFVPAVADDDAEEEGGMERGFIPAIRPFPRPSISSPSSSSSSKSSSSSSSSSKQLSSDG